VFVILTKYTKDEDTLIAGLLHDTLEDTAYTAKELEKDFGTRVKDIVLGVTEQKTKNDEVIEWEDMKMGYVKGLETAPMESLYVSAADKIHNFQSSIDSYQDSKEAYKKDFVEKDRVMFYGLIVEVLVNRLGKDHELAVQLQEIFDKYKDFLEKMYK
jgi:(p)ppGpp synthase/HD superfamily hydrolase